MKKAITLAMTLVLLCAVGAWAESAPLTFDQLAGLEWSFSSGVGGWSAEMAIAPDGTFSGNYHDSEMGETGDDYPNGTVYVCAFSGQMTLLEQVDAHSWKVRIDKLTTNEPAGQGSIDEGIRYVTSEPYGVVEGDEMVLYLPGTPVEALTEDMQFWAHLNEFDEKPTELQNWFLYSTKNETGFIGYGADH